jgi:hypothetical protein
MAQQKRRCIRCGCLGEPSAHYCIECGAPIVNRCMRGEGLLHDACGHINPDNAAFCAKCGWETAFRRAGLLVSPYPQNPVFFEDEASEMEIFNHPFFQ